MGTSISSKNWFSSTNTCVRRYLWKCSGSEDGIGRCMLGGSSDSIQYSICWRSGMGIRCGVRVLVVAVSMYSST